MVTLDPNEQIPCPCSNAEMCEDGVVRFDTCSRAEQAKCNEEVKASLIAQFGTDHRFTKDLSKEYGVI